MKYATIKFNDVANAPGVCLTFFTQGCPHKCKGCHNPETWDFNGGRELAGDTLSSIVSGLQANGIHRNLCIMGGEPLCPENSFLVRMIVREVKKALPDTKIYIWTGYLYEDLKKSTDLNIPDILQSIDVLIDGPYIEEERDITLPMCGSRNQRVLYLNQEKQ